MRSRRAAVAITIFLSLLCLASGASVVGTPTPSATPPTGAPTHTLVITAQNGSGGSYTVTASSQLHLKRGEQTDYQLSGPRVSGTVGERGDSRDMIRFRGHIESFQADGSIHITLDGEQIAPRVLGGQYIQISRAGNASQPIRYQFGVTGQASRGALAEQHETVSNQRIHGRVRDTADSFYFTGTITNDTITLAGPATVMINGQNASVFLTHAPPTPPTPRSSPSPTATPVLTSTDETAEPRPSPSTTVPAPTTTSAGSMAIDSFGWLETLVLGIVVVLALAGGGILLTLR
jgi:hypothetical protein